MKSVGINLFRSVCNGWDMADTTSDAGEKVDIKPIVNSQGDINQPNLNSNGTSQATPITMKQDPVSKDLTLNISESKPASQNGTDGPSVDPTRPLKTEGEASTGFQALTSLASARNLQAKGNITPDAQTSFNTFGNIAGLSTSSLTTQEQAALYKKANLFALSALAKNGGPNVKEMLAIQQKLQEFLTSLITLAGQKGPELKVKVQQLVQNLVVRTYSIMHISSNSKSKLAVHTALFIFLSESTTPLSPSHVTLSVV